MLASGQNLLAPSFQGERTDRVVQWTLWELGQTIRHNVASLPDFEDRFNLTQAGTFRQRDSTERLKLRLSTGRSTFGRSWIAIGNPNKILTWTEPSPH